MNTAFGTLAENNKMMGQFVGRGMDMDSIIIKDCLGYGLDSGSGRCSYAPKPLFTT